MLLWWGWDSRQLKCQKRLVLGWRHCCVRRRRLDRQYQDGPRDQHPHHTINSFDSWLSRRVVALAWRGVSIASVPGRVQNHETNVVEPQHVLDPDHELLAELWIVPCVCLSGVVQTDSWARKAEILSFKEHHQNWGGHEHKRAELTTVWIVRITALEWFVWFAELVLWDGSLNNLLL